MDSNIIHVISFSGGMGSFVEAVLCVEEFGKDNVLLLFADTLTEDPDLYRFRNECVDYLGCPIKILCAGESVWNLFERRKFIANTRVDICSSELKRKPLNEWLKLNFSPESVEMHLGIDYTESHRLIEVKQRMLPYVYRSLLVERGYFVPKDWSLSVGIEPPLLYSLGFAHNNCGGFCVKAGLGQFKQLFEKLPERYKYHEEKEQKVLALGGLPFLRKTIKKEKRYISLKEYRIEYLETGLAEEDRFDIGGCACALPSINDKD